MDHPQRATEGTIRGGRVRSSRYCGSYLGHRRLDMKESDHPSRHLEAGNTDLGPLTDSRCFDMFLGTLLPFQSRMQLSDNHLLGEYKYRLRCVPKFGIFDSSGNISYCTTVVLFLLSSVKALSDRCEVLSILS